MGEVNKNSNADDNQSGAVDFRSPQSDEIDFSELNSTEQLSGLTQPNQRAFLAAFMVTGRISTSAEHSNVSRANHYFWLRRDPNYQVAFERCRDAVCDHIEGGLVDRLAHGWSEPVFHNGEVVGHKRKFDNTNALKYLAVIKPKTFGDSDPIEAKIEPVSQDIIDAIRMLRQHGASAIGEHAAATEQLRSMENCVEAPNSDEAQLVEKICDMYDSVPYVPEPDASASTEDD